MRSYGFRGALINGTTDGRFLDDPRFEPLLERAEALDVPLYLHPGIPPEVVRRAYYDVADARHVVRVLPTAGWGWHAETRRARAAPGPLRCARPATRTCA